MRQRIYTVAFTAVLSGLCGMAIAAAKTAWGPMIEALEAFERQQAILAVLGAVEPGRVSPARMGATFARWVIVGGSEEVPIYEGRGPDDERLGLAFEVNGKGRNGDVFGVMALQPDAKTIKGLWFYRHRETPGYGGKIGTPWFSDMFVGKPIVGPDGTPGFTVSLRSRNPRSVDAITGATQTSYNVVDVINRRIREFLAGGRRVEGITVELPQNVASDLGLGINVPDLVRPTGKPRAPLMAPPGTRNVALGRPVSASDEPPVIGDLEQVTDGVKEAGFGNYVELMDGLQWVQIDLGGPTEIFAVAFWHEHDEPRVYYDVIVQAADDAEFTRNLRTLFSNDRDGSAGLGAGADMHYVDTYEGKVVTVGGEVARYVRLYSGNNHAEEVNRYTEVEVYGRPTGG